MIAVVLAMFPILLVLGLMLAGHGSRRAGPAGWLAAILVSITAFRANAALLLWSQLKGLMLSLWVLYIVWAALLLYRVVDEADGFAAFSRALSRLTSDPSLQRLVLAWVFASFLQGVTGFGVPVAVVAPLLVGLGVPAIDAVVASSIGHAWAVTFGSVGSSMYAMLAVTGLEAAWVAPASAAMLGGLCVLSGLVVLRGTGWKSILRCLPAIVIVGTSMAATQSLLASTDSWPLASFGAGCAGLVACVICARLPWHLRGAHETRAVLPKFDSNQAGIVLALLPYILLVLFISTFRIAVPESLDLVVLQMTTPETMTGLGWVNAIGSTQSLSLFGHTGALIAYAALLSHWVYRRRGRGGERTTLALLRASVLDARKPAISIFFLVGMSQVLGDAGMTDRLATVLASHTGAGFALAAPAMGAIGAFVTGSNTNANVLFGALQAEAAASLGLSVPVVLAGQNLGGALGSVLSPAKLVVAVSTVGVLGGESEVLRQLVRPAIAILVLFGAVTWWLA